MKNIITKAGRLSKVAIKSIKSKGYILYLQDSRDDRTEISLVLKSENPQGRWDAFEKAIYTYTISSQWGIKQIDQDFIDAFGTCADVC